MTYSLIQNAHRYQHMELLEDHDLLSWWRNSRYQIAEEKNEHWFESPWLWWFTPARYLYDDYRTWKLPRHDPFDWQQGKLMSVQEFGVMIRRLHPELQDTSPDWQHDRCAKLTIACNRCSKKRQYRGYRGLWHPDSYLVTPKGVDKHEHQVAVEAFGLSEDTNARFQTD